MHLVPISTDPIAHVQLGSVAGRPAESIFIMLGGIHVGGYACEGIGGGAAAVRGVSSHCIELKVPIQIVIN
jgi:hypothetical protein